jgi:NitT/TauT family transport system permease protein
MSVTTSATKNAPLRTRSFAPARADFSQEAERVQAPTTSRSKVAERSFSLLPPVVLALVVLLGWYISTASIHSAAINLFLPNPADVLSSLSDGISSGMFWNYIAVTIQESILGFLLAVAIAFPLGYGLVKSRLLSRAVHPYLAAGQAIPAVVIAPLLGLWLGYGKMTNMIICMLVVFFPMVMNTVLGLQTMDREVVDAARVEGASGWSLLANIEFPLALPAILTAIRTGFTLSITGALVGELVVGGDQGLGALVMQAYHNYNTPLMFATLIILAALAALYYGSTWLLVKLANAVY